MTPLDLNTAAQNTWCPGCGNFAIMNAFKLVLNSLAEEGTPLENIVLVAGIGCHAKILDYLNANSFYSLHGRVVPPAEAIKIARPGLKVIGFSGDGDSYGEGMEHLIFAAKRNIDITMIIHNNRVYGLTTGQYTPTSPLGYKGRSTPGGTVEPPINPLEVMLASGATFLARGTSHGIELLKKIFKEAIMHKGFSLVDVLQVCVTYNNLYEYYDKRVYKLTWHDASDHAQASAKIREWNYNNDKKIALGVLYKKDATSFEENFLKTGKEAIDRDPQIKKFLEGAV